ncbi:hypothetical protein ACH50O_01445 [Methylomonas sp. 2BW1-5-20]|uniref:hypothetical protein n=1 Tax=Methylomonas sp. 2BW1-5-20 TaxID=3376686 RepID=UPI00405074CA
MLNVVEPVYLHSPLSLAELSLDQLRLAAGQLQEHALGELAFIERELTEINPLRAETFTEWECKQATLNELQSEKWRWYGLSFGFLPYVKTEWPWGYVESSAKNQILEDDNWKAVARKVGIEIMLDYEKKFGSRPSGTWISQRLEGQLSRLGVKGPRGPLRAGNILREALGGITDIEINLGIPD